MAAAAPAVPVAPVVEEIAPVQPKAVEKEAENPEFKAPARRVFKRGGAKQGGEKDEVIEKENPHEKAPEPTPGMFKLPILIISILSYQTVPTAPGGVPFFDRWLC